ncbi:RNA polymerase sigma-70 factor [Gaoshiqia sediminis]|uniref:RNA polymerase sigma factor n=1 Tax=Gaoshiqia sediminis TaxID=2986998 RepID=A0AA41Y4Y1_9BACT|nr:RNA polymerase sigma-70 factor [Gaoshiqia sediminis]MCW0481601.1 RNA polymerase sigma-70 factor [Gaoshiqia sediminis]
MNERLSHKNQDSILHLKEGSSEAFRELFDAYGPRIHRFSMGYLHNSFEAEEIVQEVFLKIWKVREELSETKSLESFIFTIAKNAILNTIRKSKYEEVYFAYTKLHPQKDVLLDEELDFNELERAYRLSVEKLSPKRKEVFLLSREKNLTNAEIAQQLGVSVKTVENQMTSALSEIRKYLHQYGFSGLIFFDLFL